MNQAVQAPYKILTNEVEDRYARGWHVVGASKDFNSEPTQLDYFGRRMVAYRGVDDGQIHILDAYCPHMGADMSRGKVEGDSLRCPFHGWRWDGNGVCDEIPYADKIPTKAVIGAYPTTEENGLVFIWNDPEGNPPIEAQYPKKMDDYFSGEWTDWNLTVVPIESNCRELVDNMADMAHFGPVHYSTVESFKNIQDGHTYTQFMTGGHDILVEEGDNEGFTSVAVYEGPAYMHTTMTGSMDGQEMVTHLLVAHVPVHTEKFDIRLGVMLKKNPNLSEKQNQALVDEYTQMSIDSFIQDVDIWNNKVRVDNPLMCDGDGPLHMLRKWYSQFYMDAADVPAALTEHKEKEIKIKYKR